MYAMSNTHWVYSMIQCVEQVGQVLSGQTRRYGDSKLSAEEGIYKMYPYWNE